MRRSVPSLAETALETEAFWATGPGPDKPRREPLRSPRGNEVLVRTLYPRISRGTEVIVFQGAVQPSEYRRMRAPVQAGEFTAPLKCAYTSVGRVEQDPATLRGRDVFCPHPHQSRYLVPDDAVYPLTDGMPPERAVLAANPEPDTVSAEAALPVPVWSKNSGSLPVIVFQNATQAFAGGD